MRKERERKKRETAKSHPWTPVSSQCPSRRTGLAADVVAPHLVPLDDHDAAAPALLVEALAAPAARPAPAQRLERAARQRALGQQRRRRCPRRVAREARRQRVRDRLRREVPAGPPPLLRRW